MATRPGPWKQMWINFRKSIWYFRRKVVLIGEDQFGNKYFEKPLDDISRKERLVVRSDKDQWNPPDLPNEWFAWLQYKRSDPPTAAEIERNIVEMMKVKFRAAELQTKDKQQALGTAQAAATPAPTSQPQSQNTAKSDWANATSFPLRSDLELGPGDFRTKDHER